MGHSVQVMQRELAIPLMILLVLNIFHCKIDLFLAVFTVRLTMKVVQGNFHKFVISDTQKNSYRKDWYAFHHLW